MRVTADAAAAVIEEPHQSPAVPGDEEGTPAEPPEDAGNPESAMGVMEDVKSVEGSALQPTPEGAGAPGNGNVAEAAASWPVELAAEAPSNSVPDAAACASPEETTADPAEPLSAPEACTDIAEEAGKASAPAAQQEAQIALTGGAETADAPAAEQEVQPVPADDTERAEAAAAQQAAQPVTADAAEQAKAQAVQQEAQAELAAEAEDLSTSAEEQELQPVTVRADAEASAPEAQHEAEPVPAREAEQVSAPAAQQEAQSVPVDAAAEKASASTAQEGAQPAPEDEAKHVSELTGQQEAQPVPTGGAERSDAPAAQPGPAAPEAQPEAQPVGAHEAGQVTAPAAQQDAQPVPMEGAEKADPPAAEQGAQPVPAGLSLKDVVASEQMVAAAEKLNILWARVKGFPHWPAQVMKGKACDVRMDGVHRPSQTSIPVMFFGTLEIAWISPNDLSSWADGNKSKMHTKPKGRKAFDNSLRQVADFALYKKWPQNWWARRPPQPRAKEDAAAAADRKREADAPASSEAQLAERPSKAAKKEEGAESGELKDLQAEEDLASAPKRKGSVAKQPEPKPPPYQQLRCNLWVSRSRPKRMPKDEIPVCNCRPLAPPSSLQQRPSSAGPPLSPTKRQSVIALAADLACNRLPCSDSAPPAIPPPVGTSPADPSAALPPPGVASCEAVAPAVGPIPQPDVAFDLAIVASPAEPAQPPLPEQLPAAPASAEPSSPARVTEALPEVPAALARTPSASPAKPAAPVYSSGAPAAAPAVPAAPAQGIAVQARTGCGDNCLNRLSYIHCDPRLCPCGTQCSNRPFSMLQLPKMDLFLTENRGWGVKAAAPIPKGAFIVEYAGEVVDDAERQRRMAAAKAEGEHNFYMMEMGPGLIIDARTKGTLARFINSSCAPNCEAQKWHDAATGEIRVGIFAAQDIDPGAELTYDYMFQHAGTAVHAGAYRCMCGAPNCRGTMDTQPERFKDFGKRLDVFWDGDSVFYRGTVTAYSTTTRKHTILYDDNDVERVNLETVKHRWLDESAPMKLSPLREALEAGKTLLGDKLPPLDLEAAQVPNLPEIIPPPPDAAKAAALDDAAQLAAGPAPDQDTPMRDAQPDQAAGASEIVPPQDQNAGQVQAAQPDEEVGLSQEAVVPSLEHVQLLAEEQLETPELAPGPSSTKSSGRGRGRGRGRGGRGRSSSRGRGRGRKRKAETELDAQLEQSPDPLKSEMPMSLQGQEEVQMPKHKMWLKRCQRESQEQDPPPGSAQPDLGSMVPPAEPAPFTNISAQSAQPLPAEPADQAPASTQGELEPACTARPILQGAMQLPESSVLPAPILVAPVMPAAGAAGAHDSSPVAGSPQQGEQGLSRHAQASPQPRVYRVQPSEPSQASARQMQPRVNRAESGEPLQATPDAELLPERQLQSWQSLSAKPAAVPPPVRVRRGTPAGRLASPRPAVQGLQHGPLAAQLASGLPGLGAMAPLGSLPLPFGGLGLPAAPGLPISPLQGPLGMHVAMYNMLLLQNQSLRSQLPPLQNYLEGFASLPPPQAQWTVPQAPPLTVPQALNVVPAGAHFGAPSQGLQQPQPQMLPQWPSLDVGMSAGPQSAAPLLHQQAASFSPGMHALSVPAAYPQGFSAASDTAQATPPALPSVPAPAQPEFTTADSAPQQPPQPQPGDAQNVQQSQAEALQRMQEAANEPQSLAASEQAGAQPAHAAPESADCDAMYTSGEPPAGEAEQPEALNQVPSAAAEVKEAPGSLQESGSQTNLAASVGASILGNLSDARPHIAPDDTAAAQPEHDGNMVQHAGDSSGPSAPEQALAPAQDDISRPLGQAEAAKLLSVRDDLEQLGPGQPDVPCSGQGSHASHAQQPAEVSSADPAPQHSHWSGPEFRAAQQPAEEVPVGPPAAFLSGQHSFQQLPPIPMAEMAPASTHAHNIGAATGVAAVQASLPAPTVAPHTLRGAVHPLELPMWGPGHFAPAEGIHAGIYAPVSMPGAAAGSGSSLPASQTWQTAQLGGASIAPMPGSKAAFYASQGLPPSAPLPGYGVGQGPDFGLMQQPGAPGLFDPTALLGKGQAPAMNGFGEPGSPSRTIQTGPSEGVSPGPIGGDAELWSFLVDSPSPVPKAKHIPWAAQQSPCFWKPNGTSHAPRE